MEETSLLKVWELNNQEGYVFVSTGMRATGEKKCTPGTWFDKPFKWPDEKELIIPYIREQDDSGKDVYWCPHTFKEPRRKTESALPVKCLHSDLDEAIPPKEFPPSLLWESSPKRYAALWYLDDSMPVDSFEQLNKDFNYKIGADKNGWTVTKVLRVPGCRNHKYPDLPIVRLLKQNQRKYNIIDFDFQPEPEEDDDLDSIQVSQSFTKLINKYSKVLTKEMILKLMMSESDVNEEFTDRSGELFALEHSLYKLGIPVPDLIEILSKSGFNKFRGRRDEQRCWEREFEKVISNVGKVRTLNLKDSNKPTVLSLFDRMSRKLIPPGWLIEGFWPMGSHGIVAGPPKSYKSILIMEMAISIASGTSLFDTFPVHHQGPVLYIQNENPDWSIDDRIKKMLSYKGIETIVEAKEIDGKIEFIEAPIPFFSVDYNMNLNNDTDKEWLEKTVKEYKPLMVILDSLYMMMSGVDENSMKDVAPMMNWLLHSIAKPNNCAVVVLHHWNKNSKGSRDTRMLGSQAFRAWVDSQINAQTEEKEEHTVTFYREFPRSYGTLPPIKVQFNMGEPGNDYYKPIILADEIQVKTHSSDIRAAILERLEQGPQTLTSLSKGLDKKMVSQEISWLRGKGYLSFVNKKYEYLGGLEDE